MARRRTALRIHVVENLGVADSVGGSITKPWAAMAALEEAARAARAGLRPLPRRYNAERDRWAADEYLKNGGRPSEVYALLCRVAEERGWETPNDVKALDKAIRRELARRKRNSG